MVRKNDKVRSNFILVETNDLSESMRDVGGGGGGGEEERDDDDDDDDDDDYGHMCHMEKIQLQDENEIKGITREDTTQVNWSQPL